LGLCSSSFREPVPVFFLVASRPRASFFCQCGGESYLFLPYTSRL
jgi:hypothetical protein